MTLVDHLGLPAGTETVIALFAADRDLEVIWRERADFVAGLREWQPTAVITPSYSTWLGDLWPEHRYSMKRSFEFLRILQDNGVVGVPHMAWGREVDAADLAAWLNQNKPSLIAVDAQCLGPVFEGWLGQLRWLRGRLERIPTLVVGGVRPGLRLHRLIGVWPEISVIYNSLRSAGAHRELRLRPDGRACLVRHGRASDADRPTLWAEYGSEKDETPSVLYERSLCAVERSMGPHSPA